MGLFWQIQGGGGELRCASGADEWKDRIRTGTAVNERCYTLYIACQATLSVQQPKEVVRHLRRTAGRIEHIALQMPCIFIIKIRQKVDHHWYIAVYGLLGARDTSIRWVDKKKTTKFSADHVPCSGSQLGSNFLVASFSHRNRIAPFSALAACESASNNSEDANTPCSLTCNTTASPTPVGRRLWGEEKERSASNFYFQTPNEEPWLVYM